MATRLTAKLREPADVFPASEKPPDKLLKESNTSVNSLEAAIAHLKKGGMWREGNPACMDKLEIVENALSSLAHWNATTARGTNYSRDNMVTDGLWAIIIVLSSIRAEIGTRYREAYNVVQGVSAQSIAAEVAPLVTSALTEGITAVLSSKIDEVVNKLADKHSPAAADDWVGDWPASRAPDMDAVLAKLDALPAAVTSAVSASTQKPTYAQLAANGPSQATQRTYEQQDAIARTGFKERQILVNAKHEATRDWLEEQPQALTNRCNAAIRKIIDAKGLPDGIADEKGMLAGSMQKLPNGGAVFDLPSKLAVDWLQIPDNSVIFNESFGAEVELKRREYMIVIKNVPFDFLAPIVHIDDDLSLPTPEPLRALEASNDLPANCVTRWGWIRPPSRRSPTQQTAHAHLAISSPEIANRIMDQRLSWGGYRFVAERLIPDPIRCAKCNLYGHKATNCSAASICSRCSSEGHWAKDCRSAPRCAACVKANEKETRHPCFDRDCPTLLFLRESRRERRPEDALPRFLTASNTDIAFPPANQPTVLVRSNPMSQGDSKRQSNARKAEGKGQPTVAPTRGRPKSVVSRSSASASSPSPPREPSPTQRSRRARTTRNSLAASSATGSRAESPFPLASAPSPSADSVLALLTDTTNTIDPNDPDR